MERPFNFRLERVRAIRERVEEKAQEELAQSLASKREGEQLLSEAGARLNGARQAHRHTLSAGGEGSDLMFRQLYLERSERAERAAAYDLGRREQEVGERRSDLERAARDRQVLERLKKRKRADHELESSRRETAVIDEMASNVHRRGKEAA